MKSLSLFSLIYELDLPVDSSVAGAHGTTSNWLFISVVWMLILCVLIYRYRGALHKIWNDGCAVWCEGSCTGPTMFRTL
jgi:hypothetical protein